MLSQVTESTASLPCRDEDRHDRLRGVGRAQPARERSHPRRRPRSLGRQRRPLGADLAERVAAMHKSQVLSSRPAATEDDRQRAAAAAATATQRARERVSAPAPTVTRPAMTQQTRAEALRAQFARKAELQREQLRRAGLNVKAREAGDKRRTNATGLTATAPAMTAANGNSADEAPFRGK